MTRIRVVWAYSMYRYTAFIGACRTQLGSTWSEDTQGGCPAPQEKGELHAALSSEVPLAQQEYRLTVAALWTPEVDFNLKGGAVEPWAECCCYIWCMAAAFKEQTCFSPSGSWPPELNRTQDDNLCQERFVPQCYMMKLQTLYHERE